MKTTAPRRDIANRADIDQFVQLFYERLLVDAQIGHIFTDVVALDLQHHLPKIADFWDSILLQAPVYDGNPMEVHLKLNQKTTLGKAEFDTWLGYFDATINELFEGPIAEQAKIRAASIAIVMQTKIWRSQIG